MSVKYKQSGDWKDISSSSNNAVDTVADGNMNPVTSNAVYDRLKPKYWTSSISIGTSTWVVNIYRSVDMVHVQLRCIGTGSATVGTYVSFTGAPDWCKLKNSISQLTTSPESTVLDVSTTNSVTYWGGTLNQNAEWNGTCLAADAVV